MDYSAIYWRLVERARGRAPFKYGESHHILPRCMGGTDAAENIVELTAAEHYVAHQLLVKMHPGVRGLAFAVVCMARRCSGNKAYAWLRRRSADAGAAYHTGRVRSPETRAKLTEVNLRAWRTVRKRTFSEETRRKMSLTKIGKKANLTEAGRAAISASGKRLLGTKRSIEVRQRISEGIRRAREQRTTPTS